ncbi:RNA polymerase I associated factor [Cordyceps militaris]|uniref:RNA polymerase I associated factor n=1 Tax=Cordyceps militaris TaxID=73501 RepID=A0A2H4SJN8_CORMI|nr:RNA polymerase I associated factor [Cordyceps militaris]
MVQTYGKKRKRAADSSEKPTKRVVIDAPPATVRVTKLIQPEFSPPVIVTTPGFESRNDLVFDIYESKANAKRKQPKTAVEKKMMLHSTSHPTIDYAVHEEDPKPDSKPLLHHFLGIYDPKTGEMELIEAKKMVMRASVRAKQAPADALEEKGAKQSMMDLKTDLGQTFGTKKARKVINERVLNAISPQKKDGDMVAKMDDASRAMLDSVGKVAADMATREQLQAVVSEAKPLPPVNVDAEDIQDAYDPSVIIGTDILNMLPIREWQEQVRHKEGVQTVSKFVATRVNAIASNDAAEIRLRVLRYMSFVVCFYLNTKPGRQKGTRSVPPRDKLREALAPAPEAVIENIRRKFSDAGEMRKFHVDLLITHLCAFACIADNFEVDTQDLRYDLRTDDKTMNQYFREIGARIKPTSKKGQGPTTIARLVLPLDFPKQRYIAPRRK